MVGQALANLAPAELMMGFGLAGFGVNRRHACGRDSLRRSQANLDHDVPVAGRAGIGWRAERHLVWVRLPLYGSVATTRSAEPTKAARRASWNASFPALRQCSWGWERRRHQSATGALAGGAGGELWRNAERRGKGSVRRALRRHGAVTGSLATDADGPVLSLLDPPGREAFQDALQRIRPDGSDVDRRASEYQLALAEAGRTFAGLLSTYPIRVWRFGSRQFVIVLAGEPMVDYLLGFRATYGWNRAWVTGYNHVLLDYIPSRRVAG